MEETKSHISSSYVKKIFIDEGFNKAVIDQLSVVNDELKVLRLKGAPAAKSESNPKGAEPKDLQKYRSAEYQEARTLFDLHKRTEMLTARWASHPVKPKNKREEDKVVVLKQKIDELIKEVNASKLNVKTKKLFTENNFGKDKKLALVIPEQSPPVAAMLRQQALVKQRVHAHDSSVEFLCRLSEKVVLEIIHDSISNTNKNIIQIAYVPTESNSPYRSLYQNLDAFRNRVKEPVGNNKFNSGIKKLHKATKSSAHNLSKDFVTFLSNVVHQLIASYAGKVVVYLQGSKKKNINADALRVITELTFHAMGKPAPQSA